MHRPFLFGVSSGQVRAKFCVFRGKIGVNGGEGVDNKITGKGKIIWANENVYECECLENKKMDMAN